MKKLLFLGVLAFSLVSVLPYTAYAEVMPADKEMDIAVITVWTVVPADYAGRSDVTLHSDRNPDGASSNPSGKDSLIEGLLYSNDDWKLYRKYYRNMAPDTYWVTASTGNDGDFFGDAAGAGYPDLDQRSLLPDLDREVTSIKATTSYELITTINTSTGEEKPRVNFINGAGFPQFFCIFDSTERFPETVSNIESIFRGLMKEYTMSLAETWDYDAVIRRLAPLYCETGHFDDFVNLYQPAGISLYEYAHEYTRNDLLYSLSNPNDLGMVFDKFALENPESEYAQSHILNNELIKLREWGWDIRYDMRDLEYNEEGDCITDFVIYEDGTIPRKLLFPDLGDEIPADMPQGIPGDPFGTGGTSQTGPVPTENPGKDPGEERIESFPTDQPEKPGNEGKLPAGPEAGKKSFPVLPLAGAGAAVLLAVAVVYFRKRK